MAERIEKKEVYLDRRDEGAGLGDRYRSRLSDFGHSAGGIL
jgi:hypothetical protein